MMQNTKILNLQTRKQIYDCILKNPGAHIREISRKTNIPLTTLIYHVKFLKKYELIEEIILGKNKGIYVKQSLGEKEKKAFALLRKETPRNIFVYAAWSSLCSKTQLSKELGLTTAAVSYHLKNLIDLDILEEAPLIDGNFHPFKDSKLWALAYSRNGNEIFYRLKDRPFCNVLYKLLLENKRGLSNRESVDAINYWCKKFHSGVPKKMKTIETLTNNVIDCILDIFPNPFCA